MANMRDSDTSLWLHNKLGTSNDSWTGGSICSQLNGEVLRNIKECFPDLQTQVKLKLLLSFFHIPRRNIDEWRHDLEQILEVAVGDSELWVSMVAEALKTYPATGSLNMEISDLDEVRPIFTNLANDLRQLVRKQAEQVMLPMECHYLNKQALTSVVGQQPQPTKHFTLKKKPKSALLRADLLQKSADAQSNLKKASAPVIPVRSRGMPRKMTDTTPLKGIPSRHPGSNFRSSVLGTNTTRPPIPRLAAGRKEGGVKLLDIADQPLGYAAAKKRKRQQEMEESAAKKTDAPAMLSPTSANPTTPDYAAGLTAPSYMPATPQPATSAVAASPGNTTPTTPTTPTPPTPVATAVVTPTPTATPALQSPPLAAQNPPPPLTPVLKTPAKPSPVATASPVVITPPQPQPQAKPPVQHAQVTQIRIQPQPTANSLQRRGLALTREQMLEAQDMFRTANKVTRPEKALILGFMAGSRDNPCPHLGNIVTIKLSEDQENVQQPDETYLTMLVETHFQMNYNNGEWKRIKKYRRLDNVVDPLPANTQTAALV